MLRRVQLKKACLLVDRRGKKMGYWRQLIASYQAMGENDGELQDSGIAYYLTYAGWHGYLPNSLKYLKRRH